MTLSPSRGTISPHFNIQGGLVTKKKYISIWLCLLYMLAIITYALFCLGTGLIFIYYFIGLLFASLLNVSAGQFLLLTALGLAMSISGITTAANCTWKFLDTYAPKR